MLAENLHFQDITLLKSPILESMPAIPIGARTAGKHRHLPGYIRWDSASHHSGVSENVVYPEKPNGFADHYPYEKWLFHWGFGPHFQTYPFDKPLIDFKIFKDQGPNII